MKTIVFPTDFSLNSMHAVRYGINLFKGQEVRFILFNAYVDPSVGASMTYVFEDHMKVISMTMLRKVLEELKDAPGQGDLEIELVNRYGDLPYALKPFLVEEMVDLVIMGNSGASGANISILGSNSFSTMKDAPCPVLAIPLQAPIKSPERIGLASEDELKGDEDLLEPLYDIAKSHGAKVMGIHVSEKRSVVDKEEEELTFFGSDKLPYIDLNINDPLNGIQLAIGENNIDMLSIIIPKRTLLDRIFHKSISKQITSQIAIPILALHS